MTAARRVSSAALTSVLLSASTLAAQSVLTGTVRQDSTGRPLAGVDVSVAGSDQRTLTDNSGRYSLNRLPPGRRMVLFRSIGFRPVQEWVLLGQTDTLWANPMMIPSTVRLDPIVVTAAPNAPRGIGVEAFEERRRLGFGKFIDSTLLRRSEHRQLSHLLEGFPGILFERTIKSRERIPYSTRMQRERKCYLAVYLDGSPLPAPVDVNMFEPASLSAVEYYRSAAEVPVEYGGTTGQCGAILLWTRRG